MVLGELNVVASSSRGGAVRVVVGRGVVEVGSAVMEVGSEFCRFVAKPEEEKGVIVLSVYGLFCEIERGERVREKERWKEGGIRKRREWNEVR